MLYEAKEFRSLKGMPGFSDGLLENHLALYEGYVKQTNEVFGLLAGFRKEKKVGSYEYGEVTRRLGWEWNGMRLHELYFSGLGGKGSFNKGSELSLQMETQFGGYENWEKDFKAVGEIRGIGWVALYHDPLSHRLLNMWIDEHDVSHPAGCTPLLVMDVFEHAFMMDYGLNKKDYIESFFRNIDWNEVTSRFGKPL
jgi:Fe-Mn family superoxide dismutase